MYAKFIFVATLVVFGLFFVSPKHSKSYLTDTELQTAVGVCEAHSSLVIPVCGRTGSPCGNFKNQGDCHNGSYEQSCVAIGGPEPNGAGEESHKRDNCSNTYATGTCAWSGSLLGCVPLPSTDDPIPCGILITTDAC